MILTLNTVKNFIIDSHPHVLGMGNEKSFNINWVPACSFIMVTILSVAIKPVIAASSSLPEGARLGSGMGFRSPFMGHGRHGRVFRRPMGGYG